MKRGSLARGLSMAATTVLAGALCALAVAVILLSSGHLSVTTRSDTPPPSVSQVR